MIRVLEADDATAFRALRLEGLRDCPTAFAASFDEDAARDDFAHLIRPTDRSWVLGAFADANALVGCIGWYRERGAKVCHKSKLWGMYVTPTHRRRGIARCLVNEALTRAKELSGLAQIELFVASHNEAAARLYQTAGFERVGVHPRSLLVDGRYIDEDFYVRRLL
jgi:ribosomal protein S18 acetylase RimI-like enzyme